MYLLTLRDGKTLKFSVQAVAELYRDLYGGKLAYTKENTYA